MYVVCFCMGRYILYTIIFNSLGLLTCTIIHHPHHRYHYPIIDTTGTYINDHHHELSFYIDFIVIYYYHIMPEHVITSTWCWDKAE